MVERIKEIIRLSGLSHGEFSDRIGIQKSSLSHVISGRNKPSLDFVLKILEAFPHIEPKWLLFGASELPNLFTEPNKGINESEAATYETPKTKSIPTQPPSDSSFDKVLILKADGTFDLYLPSNKTV